MKRKLTTILCAALVGGMFLTGCMKNEESESVRNIRDGYAKLVAAEAAVKEAAAEAARIQNRIDEVLAKLAEGTYEAQLAADLKELEVTLATQTTLLATEQKKLMEEQAKLDASNAAYLEFVEYYNQLTTTPGWITKRSATVTALGNAYGELNGSTAIGGLVEQLAKLKRDSIDAQLDVNRVEGLITTYTELSGKTVDELKAEASAASVTVEKAVVVQNAASVTAKELLTVSDAAKKAYDKVLANLTSQTYTDGITYEMIKANSDEAISGEFTVEGYRDAVKFANARILFLENTEMSHELSNGWEYTNRDADAATTIPNATHPSLQWIKNRAAELTNQENYLNNTELAKKDQLKTAYNNGTSPATGNLTWAAAKTAYETQVKSVGDYAKALHGTVPATAPSSTTAVKTIEEWVAFDGKVYGTSATLTFVATAQNYVKARLKLDFPSYLTTGASGAIATAAGGSSYDEVNAFLSSSSFSADFIVNTLKSDFFKEFADINVLNYYSQPAPAGTTAGTAPSNSQFNGSVSIPANTSIATNTLSATEVDYAKTDLGKLRLLSQYVYGATNCFGTDVMNGVIPYTSEPNLSVQSSYLSSYSTSLFGSWWTAEKNFATNTNNLKEDKEKVAALQVACENDIVKLKAFQTKYQALLDAEEAKYADAESAYQDALFAYNEADAILKDATNKVNDAKGICTAIANGDLKSIKAYYDALKTELGVAGSSGALEVLDNATEALHTFYAAEDKAQVVKEAAQKKVEYYTQELANIDAIIAALQTKMSALL